MMKIGSSIGNHETGLYDPDTEDVYSSNKGDYWNLPENHVMKNDVGKNLWLVKNGTIISKTVRNKDLQDSITLLQKSQRSRINKRKSVARGALFLLVMDNGDDYLINSKGLMHKRRHVLGGIISEPKFSEQWALYGVTRRWNESAIENWDDVLKNPKEYIGGYVYDLDNGTFRQWSGRRIRVLRRYKG